MRKLLSGVAIIAIIGLVGCNKDEFAEIESDLSSLKDSLNLVIYQHNSLLDSISLLIETVNSEEVCDINALKMSQVGSLFESIARQPEASNTLIQATEMLFYDYTELLPFSDSTIEQRGYALASLFESIARQPEAYGILDSAATKFLGEFNPSYMSNDFVEGKARGIALNNMFVSIARQPQEYGKIDSLATKFIGVYDPEIFHSDLIEVSKGYAMSGLVEGLARQPEADSLFNLASINFLNFNFLE